MNLRCVIFEGILKRIPIHWDFTHPNWGGGKWGKC